MNNRLHHIDKLTIPLLLVPHCMCFDKIMDHMITPHQRSDRMADFLTDGSIASPCSSKLPSCFHDWTFVISASLTILDQYSIKGSFLLFSLPPAPLLLFVVGCGLPAATYEIVAETERRNKRSHQISDSCRASVRPSRALQSFTNTQSPANTTTDTLFKSAFQWHSLTTL